MQYDLPVNDLSLNKPLVCALWCAITATKTVMTATVISKRLLTWRPIGQLWHAPADHYWQHNMATSNRPTTDCVVELPLPVHYPSLTDIEGPLFGVPAPLTLT